jgi:hypothetical protein
VKVLVSMTEPAVIRELLPVVRVDDDQTVVKDVLLFQSSEHLAQAVVCMADARVV